MLPLKMRIDGRAAVVFLMAMDYMAHIERRRDVCGGQPVVKGTRVLLRTLLATLAEGESFENIFKNFPAVTTDDLRAVIAFAANAAAEDVPLPSLPAVRQTVPPTRTTVATHTPALAA